MRILGRQWAEFRKKRRKEFVEAQPSRLKQVAPEVFARAFANPSAALAFVEQMVNEALVAGICDRANIEALLDSCLTMGWISPEARARSGVKAILEDPVAAGVEKVTRIVNAAAFSFAQRVGAR